MAAALIKPRITSLEDLLEVELEPGAHDPRADVGDIVNYIAAMNHGLSRIDQLPLSLLADP